MGLCFIGIVKIATKQYLMAWLSNVKLQEQGNWKGLICREFGHPIMLTFVWMSNG